MAYMYNKYSFKFLKIKISQAKFVGLLPHIFCSVRRLCRGHNLSVPNRFPQKIVGPMAGILSILSSFLEANGLGGPDFWGRSILVMQAFHLLINTYLELRFLVPMLVSVSVLPSSAFLLPRLLTICQSLYFVLLQFVAFVLLLFRLMLNSMILPLIGVHLVLIASILLQLVQMLFTGQTGTELFIWCWYLSACVTFTLYQAMLFSTERSPKLCATIAPARTTRARRFWLAPHPPPLRGQLLAEARGLRLLEEAVVA